MSESNWLANLSARLSGTGRCRATDRRPRHRRDGSRISDRPAMVALLEPRSMPSGVAAAADGFLINHDHPLTVSDPSNGVLANDSGWTDSGDGSNTYDLQASLKTGPAHGSLSLNTDGSFAYTPAAGFIGADTFTYTASYGPATQDATVTIDVFNNAPELTIDSTILYDDAIENGAIVATVTSWDADRSGPNDPLDVPVYSMTDPQGIFAIDPLTGVITVVNADNIDSENPDTVTVSVTDSHDTVSQNVEFNAVGQWRILAPAAGATLPVADPLIVEVRHPDRYAFGCRVLLLKDGVVVGQQTIQAVLRGTKHQLNFGTRPAGDYEIVYEQRAQDGTFSFKDSRDITIK